MSVGYSGTHLPRKLGIDSTIEEGTTVTLVGAKGLRCRPGAASDAFVIRRELP